MCLKLLYINKKASLSEALVSLFFSFLSHLQYHSASCWDLQDMSHQKVLHCEEFSNAAQTFEDFSFYIFLSSASIT